jgi:Flp pilus assembly protein TadD
MGTGYADAENTAERSFLQAKQLAPTRPEIPYAEAQFELARGNAAAARLNLREALKLKPDYEPARTLLRRL